VKLLYRFDWIAPFRPVPSYSARRHTMMRVRISPLSAVNGNRSRSWLSDSSKGRTLSRATFVRPKACSSESRGASAAIRLLDLPPVRVSFGELLETAAEPFAKSSRENRLVGVGDGYRTRDLLSHSRKNRATWGSGKPLPFVFLRKFVIWGNPRKPRAATDCQPFVSQLAPGISLVLVTRSIRLFLRRCVMLDSYDPRSGTIRAIETATP
jgi:hypothetical protein